MFDNRTFCPKLQHETLVRMVGVEPTHSFERHPLKVVCLPFHHIRILAGLPGIEPRTSDSESDALPITPQTKYSAARYHTPVRGSVLIVEVPHRRAYPSILTLVCTKRIVTNE